MKIGNRGFGRRNQIPLAQRLSIKTLLNRISLIQKFRKLPNSLHAFRLNHEWRTYLGILMLVHMQIQKVLNQGPFQPGTPTCVE